MIGPDARDGPRSRHREAAAPLDLAARQDAEVVSRVTPGAVTARQRAAWLRLSDERDLHLRLRLDAWRDGYRIGHERGYDCGYLDGIAARKHAQHLLVDLIGRHLARWDGLRRDFGKPRPGEYTGGPVDFWSGRRRS
jgi:hypothetical protein